MVAFDVCVHLGTLVVDVKFATPAKVIHAWTVACVNQWIAIVVIYAHVLVVLVDLAVKQVRSVLRNEEDRQDF